MTNITTNRVQARKATYLMSTIAKNPMLLSHQSMPENLKDTMQKTKDRIKQLSDKPHVSLAEQLILVDALAQF